MILMPSSTAARGEEARRRPLAAALEPVPERGRPAVGTRVLVERAGVTPSVVHDHFASVQAVLGSVEGYTGAAVDGLLLRRAPSPGEIPAAAAVPRRMTAARA